jgi:hypothetical protein
LIGNTGNTHGTMLKKIPATNAINSAQATPQAGFPESTTIGAAAGDGAVAARAAAASNPLNSSGALGETASRPATTRV